MCVCVSTHNRINTQKKFIPTKMWISSNSDSSAIIKLENNLTV